MCVCTANSPCEWNTHDHPNDNCIYNHRGSIAELTWISEIEVIFNVTGDVVVLFVLCPVGVGLLIIADENSKKHNHSNLPDKADCRQTETHIGILCPAKEIPHAVNTVPHVDDSLVTAGLCSSSSALTRYLWRCGEVCPTLQLIPRGCELIPGRRKTTP